MYDGNETQYIENHWGEGANMSTIIGVKTYDLRFPTSSTLSGSDAMNKDPDYPRHTSSSPPTRMAA